MSLFRRYRACFQTTRLHAIRRPLSEPDALIETTHRHRALDAHTGIRTGYRAGYFLAGVLVSLLICGPSIAQERNLSVHSFTPMIGAEETSVTVEGEEFSTDPEDHVVFVQDPYSDLGAVLEGGRVLPGLDLPDRWTGAIGPAAAPFSGRLTMWKGRRFALSPRIFEGEAGVYLIEKAEWFVPSAEAFGPRPFSVESVSPQTTNGQVRGLALAIDIGFLDVLPTEINLTVVRGGGGTKGPGCGEKPFVMALTLKHLEYRDGGGELLAQDMATVLGSSFDALGLKARSIGTELHISCEGQSTEINGFAVLSGQGSKPD